MIQTHTEQRAAPYRSQVCNLNKRRMMLALGIRTPTRRAPHKPRPDDTFTVWIQEEESRIIQMENSNQIGSRLGPRNDTRDAVRHGLPDWTKGLPCSQLQHYKASWECLGLGVESLIWLDRSVTPFRPELSAGPADNALNTQRRFLKHFTESYFRR